MHTHISNGQKENHRDRVYIYIHAYVLILPRTVEQWADDDVKADDDDDDDDVGHRIYDA